MVYSTRTTCRLCNGNFEDVISLGDIHLSTFLDTNENQPPKAPVDLVRCVNCNLLQLKHTVNPDVMYNQYWYQSGLNQSMVTALKDVVDRVKNKVALNNGDVVLDIGANDGTLLTNYPEYVTKIGCEPSNLAHLAKDNCDILINNFFSLAAYDEAADQIAGRPRAKVITAIAMFYDLEDPHSFVEDLRSVLADDGLLVIQMMDIMSMVKLNDFPNLCHEHLEYYSLEVLYNLLAEHGLEIVDAEYNGVNGGSLRVYAKSVDMNPHAYVADEQGNIFRAEIIEHIDAEREFFSKINLAEYFKAEVETVKRKVVEYILQCNAEEQTIAVLGASTKGNTTLQYFGLNNSHIIHAAEVNPDKYGKRTVGTNIPIIPQTESLELKPDYYLVLPWGFIDFFIKKFDTYLRNGGKFIVPLPQPRVIECNSTGEIVECPIP